jgi:DNA gyrase subunit A
MAIFEYNSGDLFVGKKFSQELCLVEIHSTKNEGKDYTILTIPKIIELGNWNLGGPILSSHSYDFIGNSSKVPDWDKIKELLNILADPALLTEVIRAELLEVKQQFADARRTEIVEDIQALTHEDLITPENVVLTLSHEGYVKIQPLSTYEAQHRGGKGKAATAIKEEDFIENLFIAHTHDTILCFSDQGKVYWLKVYQLPQGSRTSRGRPLVNLLPLEQGEHINAILPISEYSSDKYVFMATAKGVVKKVSLNNFSHPRSKGIIAMDLQEGDHLIGVKLTDGSFDVALFSDAGKVIRFKESQVRSMGRVAKGVCGIRLKAGQKVIALVVVKDIGTILTVTENGYGKRTDLADYPTINRGGQGVMSIQINERNGKVVGAILVQDEDEMMLISDQGSLIRTRAAEVSIIGRTTQGVRLINLDEKEKLVTVQRISESQLLIVND